MKQIFTLLLLMFTINAFSQIKKIDSNTQIVKHQCEIIVITTDSLVSSNMRNVPELVEEVGCYSSISKSTARMFWFRIESEAAVQRALNPYLVKVD